MHNYATFYIFGEYMKGVNDMIIDTKIQLGTIRVDENHNRRITVYKDKEIIGELVVNVNNVKIEEKILNLLKLLES